MSERESRFLERMMTPEVKAAQARYYGRSQAIRPTPGQDRLGEAELAFIRERDSFYMATVNTDGWPYVQHRGGSPGFLTVLGPSEVGFADLAGNRQLITTGNLAADDRVCLFLMSYPQRARLKILGRAQVLDPSEHPDLARTLAPKARPGQVERLLRIRVEAFDWNCPQHITPRFTEAEIEEAVRPLRDRIAKLEAELAKR